MSILIQILTIVFIIPYTRAALGATNLAKIPLVDFCLADADRSEVVFYLFKSTSQTEAITLTSDAAFPLPRNDSLLPTKIIIHGYTTNISAPWIKPLKHAFFRKGPHNVIYIDWAQAARTKNYSISGANILPVGEFVADMIINLRVPLKNVHVLGHSLGGHLAGFVGKHVFWKTGRRVGRITAFDPTGPSFERAVVEARLNKQDADFVDVVHTDIGYYGAVIPLGHVDFYVNGGIDQPGCPRGHDTDENCHHQRSPFYFIESINKRNVMAVTADLTATEEIVVKGKPGEDIEFGDPVNQTARGIYYIGTNSGSPYLTAKV